MKKEDKNEERRKRKKKEGRKGERKKNRISCEDGKGMREGRRRWEKEK